MIKHIAEVDPLTGNIEYLYLSQGVNPPEGNNPETGCFVVYIYEEINQMDFVEHRYYHIPTNTWIERPSKPNPFAFWTGTFWDWNDTAFLEYIRSQRNEKLSLTDWTQLPDAPLTEAQKIEAQTYRQALRDMTAPIQQNPENYDTEESIPWPTPPSFLNIEI